MPGRAQAGSSMGKRAGTFNPFLYCLPVGLQLTSSPIPPAPTGLFLMFIFLFEEWSGAKRGEADVLPKCLQQPVLTLSWAPMWMPSPATITCYLPDAFVGSWIGTAG